MTAPTYCVIMAGGIGSRFWPLSTDQKPKQFLDIFGTGRSFLQQTFDRFAPLVAPEHVMVVTAAVYKDIVHEQLPQIPLENILLEPVRRNTAPCIAYATHKIRQRHPEATVVVAPSDHLILNHQEFEATLNAALQFAGQRDALITLGIKPTRPETGYGYIQAAGKEATEVNGRFVYPVKSFTEKPTEEIAKVLIDSGEFYWNSGIFVWRIASIAAQLQRWLPDVDELFRNGEGMYNTDLEAGFIAKAYAACRNVSIDYGVMEKAQNTYVFSAQFDWSDVGSWESYYLHKTPNEEGNVVVASGACLDKVTHSLVYTTQPGKTVVIRGLENFLVVDTPQVLLLCPRNEKELKQIKNTYERQ